MRFEKFFNSKVFIAFEYLYVIIISNLLFVLSFVLGLGIFSFMPALISLVIMLKTHDSTTEFPLLSVYVKSFMKNYWKSMKVFLLFLIGIVVFTFNTLFFYFALEESDTFFFAISFYMMLILDVVLLFAMINAAFVYVYFPNLSVKKIIKYAFLLLRVVSIQSLILVPLLIIVIAFGFWIPILALLFLVSAYVLVMDRLLRTTYQKLISDGVTSLDAFLYVHKNNRK